MLRTRSAWTALPVAVILAYLVSVGPVIVSAAPIQLWCPWTAGETWIAGGAGSFYGENYHTESRSSYYAVDFNKTGGATADDGAPILAAADGTIAEIRLSESYGWLVRINHTNSCQSLYAHLKFDPRVDPGIAVGQWVPHGTCIGKCGTTGWSTGTHLHFCLFQSGSSVAPDPMSGQSLWDGAVLTSDNRVGPPTPVWQGHLDQPEPNSEHWCTMTNSMLGIYGWAWDQSERTSCQRIGIFINGVHAGDVNYFEYREDLRRNIGFAGSVNVMPWSGQRVTVVARVFNNYGQDSGDTFASGNVLIRRPIPRAPTGLSPSGEQLVRLGEPVHFTWHDNGMDNGEPSWDFNTIIHDGDASSYPRLTPDAWKREGDFWWTFNAAKRYCWRVRAGNGMGPPEGEGDWAYFRVTAGPGTPTPLTPAAGSTVAAGPVHFTWQDPGDEYGPSCDFSVQIRKAGETSPWQTLSWDPSRDRTATIETPGNYEWRVDSGNGVGGSHTWDGKDFSDWVPFTVTPPGPVLSWADTNGFIGDGVAPDEGLAGTLFTFKVKYTGPNPDFVRLRLYHGGDEVGVSPLAMTPISGNPDTGQVFMVKKELVGTQRYVYRFEARGNGRAAVGPATQYRAGPSVTPGPDLSWAGTNGFLDDGVAPDSTYAGTLFTFKVRYTGPDPRYVRLRLYYDGTEVGVSPLAMAPVTGSSETGQVFAVKKVLTGTGRYTYRFEAEGGGVAARGVATQFRVGPSVSPGPTLSWAGTNGFGEDGVAPDSAFTGSLFTFKVKYTGPNADFVRLRLYYQGAEVSVSPLAMAPVSGSPATGQVFVVKHVLNGTRRYSYRFEARGAGATALGAPTREHTGPVVSPRPVLAWAGTNGFLDDGAAPDRGAPGTQFTYKVKYTGPAPDLVRVRLYYRGSEVGCSPLIMAPVSGSPATGQIFMVRKTLSGTMPYAYCFEARSNGVWATGPPTQLLAGPVVTAVAPSALAMVTALTCLPSPLGAQITFSQSASANVTVEVLNIAGRPIRTIVTDRLMPMGVNELYWDGRSNEGLSVPNGTYVIRLTMRSETGTQVQAVTTVQVSR